MDEIARSADISRQGLYLHFASKDALFRAAVRQELDTALGEVSRCLSEEGVGLERRVVAALDAWLGRYVGSMLVPIERQTSQLGAPGTSRPAALAGHRPYGGCDPTP